MSSSEGEESITHINRNQYTPITEEEQDKIGERLQESLELFDFTAPLPPKQTGVLRLFYNNCNGIAINNTIGMFLKQKRDKKKYDYIKDINTPTKLDGILRQMKLWEVDLVALAEICVAWEDNVPRRVIQQITSTYDANACWVGSSSKVSVGSFCKPGGTGTLLMGQHTGRILDKGSDPWNMGRWSYVYSLKEPQMTPPY